MKAIGTSLNTINLPKGVELTGKVLLGIVKQGSVYVMPRREIQFVSVKLNTVQYQALIFMN